MKIRNVKLSDAKDIVSIYNYYVKNSVVTFDEIPLSIEDIRNKIETVSKNYPFIVIEDNEQLVGYAYGSQFRPKPAYGFTVEVTIYLENNCLGKGYGTNLFSHLLNELKEKGYHNAMGVLGLPNLQSQSIHEKFGFKKIGHLSEVGYKFGKWIDVGLWEKIL